MNKRQPRSAFERMSDLVGKVRDMSGKPTVVELFAGAGGLSWGLTAAGFNIVYAQDYWSDAVDTYRHNMPGHFAECGDVHDLSAAHLARVLDDNPQWVVGGPPCQGYSTVGKRNRDDDRNRLFLQFRRVVKLLKPEGFVIENVLGLKDMSFEDEVAASFRKLGYRVSFHVVSAADYGVPQFRRRVIFVGHRERLFSGVPTTHTEESWVTVGDAILDLPTLKPGHGAYGYDKAPHSEYAKNMRSGNDTGELQGHTASRHPDHLVKAISYIPDGGNRTAIPAKFQPRSGFHNSYSRLASWTPAVAITQNMGKPSGSRSIHPTQHRGLTTREGARLQSFPDQFHFTGPSTSQRLQVANAVPPLLAEALGMALQDDDNWQYSDGIGTSLTSLGRSNRGAWWHSEPE